MIYSVLKLFFFFFLPDMSLEINLLAKIYMSCPSQVIVFQMEFRMRPIFVILTTFYSIFDIDRGTFYCRNGASLKRREI